MSAEIPLELAEHVARVGGTLSEFHGQWYWTEAPKLGETYVRKFSYAIVSDTRVRTVPDYRKPDPRPGLNSVDGTRGEPG